ncbi:hypothetical protein RJT34_02816 [Clitoria ternatea]|uniref:NADPH oxidase Respiratory burst domain-containing protein n=1 Tax=Clitoria ternatea TaxID=43366 RepID=A0AAN9KL06_CLITE
MLPSASKQLKRLALFSKPAPKNFEMTKSTVGHALIELKFISKADGGAGWAAVEKWFHKLTTTTDGYLPRSLFAQCLEGGEEPQPRPAMPIKGP